MTSNASPRYILFAGGCHVNGYPIGEEASFSHLTARSLGFTATRIAPISLGNASRLFDHLERHGPPEVAVLQFGNYEVPRPIAKHARAVFSLGSLPGSHRSSLSSKKRPWLSLPPNHVFHPTPGWHLRSILKRAYAGAAQYASPPLYDADAVRERLRWLLSQLAPFQIPITVVLSPLPCADHMARNFRIAAAPIFQDESSRAHVLSLDTPAVLGYSGLRPRRSFDIYADERHLNGEGHKLLAEALIKLLRPLTVSEEPVALEEAAVLV